VLLELRLPAPEHHPAGFWRRLTDPPDWRATLHALLLPPVGTLTGTLALIAWTATAAALASPLYAPTLAGPVLRLRSLQVAGPRVDALAIFAGVLVLFMLPRLVHLLARVDAALARTLLR
jgi:hypothetical protein